jgi:hypothetical protein
MIVFLHFVLIAILTAVVVGGLLGLVIRLIVSVE